MKTLVFVIGLLGLTITVSADISRAQQLFDEQRFGETLERIDTILTNSATHQQALFLKAMTLQQIGRISDAIRTYQLLTREYPKSPETYNNLAVLYAQQGKHKLARDTLLIALNTHPSYATAYKNLSNIYSRMASNAYSKALNLDNKKQPTVLTLATIKKIAPTTKIIAATKLPFAKNPIVIAKVKTNVKSKPHAGDSKEIELIIDTINGWANAWSAQDSDAYLAYYANNFSPSNGSSKQRWKKERRFKLRKPTFIRISIQSPKVVLLSKNSARLIFKQNYQSNNFHDAVIKTLLLKKVNGSWQILKEYIAS